MNESPSPDVIDEDEILRSKAEKYEDSLPEAWLGPEPDIPEALIRQTVETDVVVVGAGLAGVCAARAAAEEGARVVLIEKSTHFNARSGQYFVPGGKINEHFGRPAVDPDLITDHIMREGSYRIKRPIIARWAKHAHEVFDWFIAAKPELYVAKTTDEPIPSEHRRLYLAPLDWPLPPGYDYRTEQFPVFPNSMMFWPGHAQVVKASLDRCTDSLGVKVFYAHKAEKLERRAQRFCGLLARDMRHGGYIRFTAGRGIILATGDNAGDPEILKRFYPSVIKHGVPLTPMRTKDAEGKLINTGDGLRMGAWAGAKVQEYHAVSAHNMGLLYDGMGVTPFLFLNRRGRRFMNECVPGQQLQNQLEMQPGHVLHQIFDDNWRDQMPFMPPYHGAYCAYSPVDDDNPVNSTMTEPMFQHSLENGTIRSADTLEALMDQLDVDKAEALRSIERYNALARAGRDEDFHKPAGRMFPIEKGPFYASTFGLSPMLSCIGGLESDENCRVYAEDGRTLPGLYVAGNVQGCIYAGEYPICARGMSHSVCMFYGYVAGKNAAANIV